MLRQDKIKNSVKVLKPGNGFEKIVLIFSICMVIAIYWRWVLPGAITWGDWFYFTKSDISSFLPTLWYARSGLGSHVVSSVPIYPIQILEVVLCRAFNFDYSIIERLLIFMPLVFFLIFSPWYLARTLGFGRIATAAMILVFNLNSVVFSNAHVPLLGLSDAMAPLVFALFIWVIRHPDTKRGLLFGFLVALQMVMEIRGCYITLFFCGLYFIYSIVIDQKTGQEFWRICKSLLLSAVTVILLHSYWIIPLLFGKTSGTAQVLLPETYKTASALKGLSYMTLLHSLGINLPFWGCSGLALGPVNPRFLLLPMIAFSVLLFGRQKRKIIFFALSALIFSFLVKGSKPPFGGINIWLFLHFPGFFMFRTPGKWYMPLTLSYAVLVGYLIDQVITRGFINNAFVNVKRRFNLSPFIIKTGMFISLVAVIFIVFPVQPISTLRYSSILEPRPVPEESSHFEVFLDSQKEFFRILWLPNLYRFGYFSTQHPAIMGYSLGPEMLSSVLMGDRRSYTFSYLGKYFSPWILRLFCVKYIIVPSVPVGSPNEIYYWFEHPPKYYRQLVEKTPGLQPVSFKGESQLYEVPNPLPHFYAASDSIAVIDDDISAFPAISTTGAVKNAPVILLRDQISRKSLQNINSFVFRDSSWQDLAIEIAGYKLQVTGKSTQLNIEKAGIYEVYFDVSETEEKEIPKFDIKVDGKEMLQVTSISSASGGAAGQAGRKYVKVGEVELKGGKHKIEVIRVSRYQDIRQKEIKLVLVNDEEPQRAEKLIWEKMNQPGSDLYYIFTKDGEFYVPQGADYVIIAKVPPYLARKKDKIGAEFRFGIEEGLKDWGFYPSYVAYDYSVSKDEVLVLPSYFDGGGMEDEYVQMQNRKVRIDLKEYPYFDLVHRIEDSEVQIMQIVAGIDFDKDGKVDEYIRGIYSRPVSLVWDNFSYNLYGKAKGEFPDKKNYDLIHLELYPHKLWGVDCSKPEKKREYKFWLKSLQFYGYSKEMFFQDVEDVLEVKMDSEGELKRWSIKCKDKDYSLESKGKTMAIAELPGCLELSRPVGKIDISRFSMIELEYKVENPDRQDIEIVFDLDFNGDSVIDRSIFLGYLQTSKKEWDKFQIDAYRLVKRTFPVEKKYNLMQIKLRLKEYHPFYLKRLRVYSSSLVSPADFVFDRPVLEIDGRKYWLKARFKDKADAGNLWFRQIVHLEKGRHYLDKLADDSFGVEWVVLEPVQSSKSKVQGQKEEPEIIFKKINAAKYEVRVNGARDPFWLVFNESFHKQWEIYPERTTGNRQQVTEEIVAEYPDLGVKEAKYTMKFTPGDIKYLFRESLDAEHYLVNGYANGWYIDPKKLDLPEDFTLALHFWPQSLFYLGLCVSGMTLLGCVGYLCSGIVKRKRKIGVF